MPFTTTDLITTTSGATLEVIDIEARRKAGTLVVLYLCSDGKQYGESELRPYAPARKRAGFQRVMSRFA